MTNVQVDADFYLKCVIQMREPEKSTLLVRSLLKRTRAITDDSNIDEFAKVENEELNEQQYLNRHCSPQLPAKYRSIVLHSTSP